VWRSPDNTRIRAGHPRVLAVPSDRERRTSRGPSQKHAPSLHDAVGELDPLPPLGDQRVTGYETTIQSVKRIVVALLGGTVLCLGIALIVLPGPAFVVIPAGLAILAIEFAWARRWLRSARAILPRRSKGDAPQQKKLTMQSVRRGASFLLRQMRRTLLPKRNL
jgi:hypothetical protein